MQVEVCVQYGLEERQTMGSQPRSPLPDPADDISDETWELWFKEWLELLKPGLSPIQSYEVTLRLTGDRELQQLNGDYRQQDKPTDVLAFAALETPSPVLEEMDATLPLYLGDIVISVETAHHQAQSQGYALKTELAWLAAHGLLHLLGWDHPDDASLERMLKQQQQLLHAVDLIGGADKLLYSPQSDDIIAMVRKLRTV